MDSRVNVDDLKTPFIEEVKIYYVKKFKSLGAELAPGVCLMRG